MADHDEQISNNRRRLFKALSAAPVVMTLRPGEALAAGSAFQCLTKIPQVDEFVDADEAPGYAIACDAEGNCTLDDGVAGDVAYKRRTYWLPSTEGEAGSPAATNCPVLPATVYQDESGVVRDLTDGSDVTFNYSLGPDGSMTIWDKPAGVSPPPKECKVDIPAHEGYFVEVIRTDDPSTGENPTYVGTYPEATGGQFGGTYQGITTSCMVSCTTANGCNPLTGG